MPATPERLKNKLSQLEQYLPIVKCSCGGELEMGINIVKCNLCKTIFTIKDDKIFFIKSPENIVLPKTPIEYVADPQKWSFGELQIISILKNI